MHGLAQAVILHQDDAREALALPHEVRERRVSHGERDEPVGEARRAVEPHRPAGLERALELGRPRRLHAPHRRPAPPGCEPDDDPGDQPAPTHGDHDRLDVRELLGDLEPHRRLARHDVGMVERRDDGEAIALREPLGLELAVLRRAPGEHDLGAPLLHPSDLHRGRGLGHHDHGPHAHELGGVGDRLTVVAAGVRDHALAPGGLRQASDRRVRPPDLERGRRLQVLELQVGVQRLHPAHGGTHRHAGEPRRRLPDVLRGDHAYRFFFAGVLRARCFPGVLRAGSGAEGSSASPSSPDSASSSFTTRATSTRRSPAVRFIIFTPWVFRPEMWIPSTGTRIMMPFLVIIISSSSGRTSFRATMAPVLSVRLSVMMPRPPRCWTRYSSSSERLPMPCSVTVRSVEARRTTTMSITWSCFSSSIPFTPVAVRPMSRTSFSWKRMLIPCWVASTMSFEPSVTWTSINSSPFSMLMARMPTDRGFPNSESTVFFTTPFFVANSRYWSSENSRTGTSAATRSSGFMAMQLTIGLPRAARAACGISCTFSQ